MIDLASSVTSMASSLSGLDQFQHEILWALIVGAILAFLLGFGMGANDVSNTFGTSVGSKVLTLRKAYILAAIFETLGAILVGYNVTDTMRKGVIDTEIYASEPKILMYGQLAILGGCSCWLLLATYFELPVSTTHSVVGATVGFSLCAKGLVAINWSEIGHIALSWVISPLLSGLLSGLLYLFVDICILRKKEPLEWGLRLMPFFYFICLTFNTFSITYQGSQILKLSFVPPLTAIGISLGVGIFAALVCHFVLKPKLRSWIDRKTTIVRVENMVKRSGSVLSHRPSLTPQDDNVLDGRYVIEQDPTALRRLVSPSLPVTTAFPASGFSEIPIPGAAVVTDRGRMNQNNRGNIATINIGILENGDDTGKRKRIRLTSELTTRQDYFPQPLEFSNPFLYLQNYMKRYVAPSGFLHWLLPAKNRKEDVKTLKLFSSIQVFTACFAGFAHGANDVSNAIAPLTALLAIYKDMDVSQHEPTPIYVLLFGVLSICIGLFVLGHKVIKTVGSKMSEIHAASGFTTASKLGLPISTTHSLIGSVVFVGMLKAGEGVRWSIFRNVIFSWLITLPITAALSAFLMFMITTFL